MILGCGSLTSWGEGVKKWAAVLSRMFMQKKIKREEWWHFWSEKNHSSLQAMPMFSYVFKKLSHLFFKKLRWLNTKCPFTVHLILLFLLNATSANLTRFTESRILPGKNSDDKTQNCSLLFHSAGTERSKTKSGKSDAVKKKSFLS